MRIKWELCEDLRYKDKGSYVVNEHLPEIFPLCVKHLGELRRRDAEMTVKSKKIPLTSRIKPIFSLQLFLLISSPSATKRNLKFLAHHLSKRVKPSICS